MRGLGWLAIAPRALPAWAVLVDEVGAGDSALAAHLGVTPGTVKRWNREASPPRAVCLALFYETRWGRDYVACDTENRARLLTQVLRAERAARIDAEATAAKLLAVGDFGSANSPTVHVSSTLPDAARVLGSGAESRVERPCGDETSTAFFPTTDELPADGRALDAA